jgi:hypothetical protein
MLICNLINTIQAHTASSVSGTFTVEPWLRSDLRVTLTLDDDLSDAVEYFEVRRPSGKREIFPAFLNG